MFSTPYRQNYTLDANTFPRAKIIQTSSITMVSLATPGLHIPPGAKKLNVLFGGFASVNHAFEHLQGIGM